MEYSDLEEEPLLSLKNPKDLEKPVLERGSNYISSDDDDSLLYPIKTPSEQIQSLVQGNNSNTNTNVFQENMIDLMIRLYGQPENKSKQ